MPTKEANCYAVRLLTTLRPTALLDSTSFLTRNYPEASCTVTVTQASICPTVVNMSAWSGILRQAPVTGLIRYCAASSLDTSSFTGICTHQPRLSCQIWESIPHLPGHNALF